MVILEEKKLGTDLGQILTAWKSKESFVLLPSKLSVTREWITKAVECLPNRFARDHYALFTSGTTGTPKLVIGSRVRSEQLASLLHDLQDSELIDETVVMLPLSYSYAFVNQWVWSHVKGRRLIQSDGLNDSRSLRGLLKNCRSAMLCLVGVQVPLLLRNFSGETFDGITRIHFAGGRFPQESLSEIGHLFPNAKIYNNYGCAEAMPRLTLRKASDSVEATNIGRTLPGIELRSGLGNALEFTSAYGAVAVVDQFKAQEIGPGDWVLTGDTGIRNSDGTWSLTGRVSEIFKRHGEKVSMAALSDTISEIWLGQLCFYREVDRNGENGCVIVLAPKPSAESLARVLKALRQRHQRSHWPLRIECMESLPLLSNGKADIRSLAIEHSKEVLWSQHI